MSPVEKPVVIPLEYHLIDNEFNNISNQQQQNHHNHDEQSQDQHQQQSDKVINHKEYLKNNTNNHNIELNVSLPLKNQISNSDNTNNTNNENDNLTNNNHNDNLNENNSSTNGICKINNDTNDNCNSNSNNNNGNNENENHTYPKCNRNRELFGIQLEVTSLLLEAERRKLNVLQRELKIALEDSGSVKKAKENFKQELILAILRIQSQHDLLENEYKQHAIGQLRNSKTRGTGKSNRSQPAIGLKQTPKARPTIFGTVASDQSPKDNSNKRALPQTTAISSGSFSAAGGINRKTNNDRQNTSSSSGSVSVHVQISNNTEKEKLATEENSLVYRDGNLISGPLDALIQHMVPTSDYYPDRSYIFAFLLSARLFIRPYKLLEKICQLCEEQQSFKCKLDITTTTTTKMNNEKCNNINLDCNFSNSSSNNSSSGLNDTEKIDCDHHHHQQQQQHKKDNGDDEECCRKLKKFAQNFIQLLAEWIDTFPYDFRDDRLMQHVRLMSKKCICVDNSLRKDVSTMLQNLLHRLTVLDKYEEFLQSISNDSTDSASSNSILLSSGGTSMNENQTSGGISSSTATGGVTTTTTGMPGTVSNQNSLMNQMGTYQGTGVSGGGMNASGILHHTNSSSFSTSNCLYSSSSSNSALSSIDISELCPIPTLLAHQLTHIELERLSHIGPEEFVQAFAKENPHLEQSFNDIKKTRNLESYIQWFNRLSYFVATEIVRHCKKKQRVRIVEYWIETARECFNIGNFNSLMAIIAGLNMSPISRLKKTWAKVQLAKFSVLEHQMDPSSNFNSYRSTLKAAMWRSAGATDERERIVIPFFSLLVKDLYFLNEGCSNKLENGHVNFEKFWQLAKQVTEFIAWKQVTCPFEKIPKVIMFLYTNHILNENMLALASFECEPPENHEKDRYKCLKSEQQQQMQQQQQQQQHHQHQQQ